MSFRHFGIDADGFAICGDRHGKLIQSLLSDAQIVMRLS